jgi:cytochrome b involved in lipid metabolism
MITYFGLKHNANVSKRKTKLHNQVKIFHRVIGRTLLILGFMQCIMGARMYSIWVLAFVCTWICGIVAVFLYKECQWRTSSHHASNKINIINDLQKVIEERDFPTYTQHEFRSKIATGSRWVIIANTIIDIEEWIDVHPGGSQLLRLHIGMDVTKELFGGEITILNDLNNLRVDNEFERKGTAPLSSSKLKTAHGHSISAIKLLMANVRGRLSQPQMYNTIDSSSDDDVKKRMEANEKMKDTITHAKLMHKEQVCDVPAPIVKFIFEVDRLKFDNYVGSHYQFIASDSSSDIFERPYTPIEQLPLDNLNVRKGTSHNVSANESKMLMEFYIRLYPNGKMSNFLASLNVGESKLRISGPHSRINHHKLINIIEPETKYDHVAFIVGGTGIVVFLQMLTALLDKNIYVDALWQVREWNEIFECPLLEKHLNEGKCDLNSQKYLHLHYIITLNQRPPTHLHKGNINTHSVASAFFNKSTRNLTKRSRRREKEASLNIVMDNPSGENRKRNNNLKMHPYVLATTDENELKENNNVNGNNHAKDTDYVVKRKLTNTNANIEGSKITISILKHKLQDLLCKHTGGDKKVAIIVSGPVRFSKYVRNLISQDDVLKDIELICLD